MRKAISKSDCGLSGQTSLALKKRTQLITTWNEANAATAMVGMRPTWKVAHGIETMPPPRMVDIIARTTPDMPNTPCSESDSL